MSRPAEWQAEYDTKDYRRSLYTNTKDDHPANWLTGEPCGCERGDDSAWDRSAFRSGGHLAPGPLRAGHDPCGTPARERAAVPRKRTGRSR